MQAQPSTFQGPSLLANIPKTITKFDEARLLVVLIDRLVPLYMREEVPELAPLPLALKRMDDANGTDDDELRQHLEAEILSIYPTAREELGRFLAGSSGGAPKAIQAQVASSHTTPLTQAPLGPPAIGASPAAASAILAEGSTAKRGPGRPPSTHAPGRPAAASTSKRLARRSEKDIAAVADRIVALVKKHDKGLRAEQIRSQLGIAKKEWARPLEAALASKKLTKKGEKRATTYFAK
jgi:hypothetical protein